LIAASTSSASSTSGGSSAADSQSYNDVDLIFSVDLSQPRNFDRIKTATLESLFDLFPESGGGSARRDHMSVCSMKEG
jgi:hypothetical protein